jgi:hypothetical protein
MDDPHDEWTSPTRCRPSLVSNRGNWAEWAQAGVALIGLIGVAAGVVVAYRTLARVTEQSEVMRRSFEMADRPRLKVTVTPLQSSPTPAPHLTFATIIQNVGRSVATNVTIDVGIVTHGMEQGAADNVFKRPAIEQERLCERGAKTSGYSHDRVIFPEDSAPPLQTSISYDVNAAKRAALSMPSREGRTNFGLVLVGCVTYRFGTSERVHTTRFGYHVTRTVPGQTPLGAYALTLEDFVPANLLTFSDAFLVFRAD